MSALKVDSRHVQGELRAQGDMQVAGERNDVEERMKIVFWQSAEGRPSPLLDELFGSFLDTNVFQGQHFSFDMVRKVKEKLFFRFEHAGIPYLATVHRYRRPDSDVVVLKLPNNGFSYIEKVPGKEFFWHKQPGWVELPCNATLDQFPTMQEVLRKQYNSAVLFYNVEACRIDMEFEPKDATDPMFMVTYELGSPYIDTKGMRKAF